jgi:hypothetical protein
MSWGTDRIPEGTYKDNHDSDDEDGRDEEYKEEGEQTDEDNHESGEDDKSDAEYEEKDEQDQLEDDEFVQCDAADCGRYRSFSAATIRAKGWDQKGVNFFCDIDTGLATLHEQPCGYCNDTGTSPVPKAPLCDCIPGTAVITAATARPRQQAAFHGHIAPPRTVHTQHSMRPKRSCGQKRRFDDM